MPKACTVITIKDIKSTKEREVLIIPSVDF